MYSSEVGGVMMLNCSLGVLIYSSGDGRLTRRELFVHSKRTPRASRRQMFTYGGEIIGRNSSVFFFCHAIMILSNPKLPKQGIQSSTETPPSL